METSTEQDLTEGDERKNEKLFTFICCHATILKSFQALAFTFPVKFNPVQFSYCNYYILILTFANMET